MNHSRAARLSLFLALFSALAILAVWMTRPAPSPGETSGDAVTETASRDPIPSLPAEKPIDAEIEVLADANADPRQVKAVPASGGSETPKEMLEGILEKGTPGENPGATLQALRMAVQSQEDRQGASRDLLEFLLDGRDVPTGLPFLLGESGSLDSSPALRTFVLALLGEIDLSAAVAYADSHVFLEASSPEEWAIALRNLAWSNVDGARDDALRDLFLRLANHGDWIERPQSGFLHAFDLAVHIADPAAFHQLAQLASASNEATEHAAVLAMDRMVLRQPADRLAELVGSPGMLSGNPQARAHLMARADVRDPLQRAALETYLARPDISPEEASAFASAFPARNLAFGNRLLTSDGPEKSSLPDIAGLDLASLQFLREQAQRASAGFRPALEPLQAKLEAFVESAGNLRRN